MKFFNCSPMIIVIKRSFWHGRIGCNELGNNLRKNCEFRCKTDLRPIDKKWTRFIRIDFPAFLHTSSHIAYTFPAEIAWEIHNLFTYSIYVQHHTIYGFDDCNYKSILWKVQISMSDTRRQFDVIDFFYRKIEINSKKTTKVINISIELQLVCAFNSLFCLFIVEVVSWGWKIDSLLNHVRNRSFKWISGLLVCFFLFDFLGTVSIRAFTSYCFRNCNIDFIV